MSIVRSDQRGAALITALWLTTLLMLLAMSTVSVVATDARSVRRALDGVQAKLLAESAVNRAIQLLSDSKPSRRLAIYEQSLELSLFDRTYSVKLSDESGRVDLNAASDDLLGVLFASAGLPLDRTSEQVARLRDWQDADQGRRPEGAEAPDYRRRGLKFGPANRPLGSVDELKQVLGITSELAQCVKDAVTVYSGGSEVRTASAGPVVRNALEWADRQQWTGRSWLPATGLQAPGAEDSLAGRVLRLVVRQKGRASGRVAVLRITGDERQPVLVMSWTQAVIDELPDDCPHAVLSPGLQAP